MDLQQDRGLVQALLDCAMHCEYCAYACLQEPDMKKMSNCIALDRDCADICFLGAKLIRRNSAIAMQYLLLCEEICRMCAAECGRYDHDHCQQCTSACLACADACHENHEPIQQD